MNRKLEMEAAEDKENELLDELLNKLSGIEQCFENIKYETEDECQLFKEKQCIDETNKLIVENKLTDSLNMVSDQSNESKTAKRILENLSDESDIAVKKVWISELSQKRNAPSRWYKSVDHLLPVELMIEIFKYLPISDRKATRLVCKRWYDINNSKIFMMTQRFVCCGIYETHSIITTLMKTQCDFLNLEFYHVNFKNYHVQFWQTCGPKIHALHFIDCLFSEETFINMITFCDELEHLSFVYQYCRPASKLCSNNMLFDLLKANKQRPKLISLELHLNQSQWLSNSILQNLFALFPKISRISYTCHSLYPIICGKKVQDSVSPHEIEFRDLWSPQTLTFSSILNKIVTHPDCIEKLKLDLHTYTRRTGFAWKSIINYANLHRLREISIEVDLRNIKSTAVIEFCTQQKQLKTLSCRILGSTKLFICLFLTQILENCIALRNIDVTYNDIVFISYELFKKLLCSDLQSLGFQCKEVSLARKITEEKELPLNSTLHALTLHTSYGVGDWFKLLLIKKFCNLKYLELHEVTDILLRAIWEYQTNLKCLKFSYVENCASFGFTSSVDITNTVYSIQRLKNLMYLVIEAVNPKWEEASDVFSEFVLPDLRYLCVDIEGNLKLQLALLKRIQTFSKLVGVSLRCPGVPRAVWLNLASKWKRLRYLRIVDPDSQKFKIKNYMYFFKQCPELRAFVHEFYHGSESYYYDVLEKKVKRKTVKNMYRISSEKVGCCFIDWMWF